MQLNSSVEDDGALDPAFLRARREMLVVLTLFGVALAWTIGFCYWLGYDTTDPESAPSVSLVLGFPVWVLVGIVLPWLVIDVVAIWFCFYFLSDDSLTEEAGNRTAEDSSQTPAAAYGGNLGGPTSGRRS